MTFPEELRSRRQLSGLIFSLIALFVFAGTATANTTPADPSSASTRLTLPDSLALETTAAVVALFHEVGDTVWPGYDLAARPFLIYLPDRWAVLVNAPHPIPDFTDYPRDWPRLGTKALVHVGPYDRLAGQLEFNFALDSLVTGAVAPTRALDQGRRAAIGLNFGFIVHEAFHQFQRDAFRSIASDMPEEAYPILDGDNTALASLEMLILMDAIRAVARADTALVHDLTAEFLAVRRARWGRRPEDIPLFERPQELMEGSAQYVETRSVGLMGNVCARFPAGPPPAVPTSPPSPAPPPGCDVFGGATWDLYLLADFEDRIEGGTIDVTDMARNRVYPVGAALGILLDFFHVDWKASVPDAAASPGLAELLAAGTAWDPAAGDTLFTRARVRYGYVALRAACMARARSYPEEYQAGVDSLAALPGYHVSLETRVSGLSRSRSCEGGRLVLENPTRSFSKWCHVYSLRYATNDDLLVEIRESPIVEETSPDGATRRVDFVTPDIVTIEADGRPVDLDLPGTYPFTRLRIGGSNVEIRYDGEGALSIDGERVTVRLLPEGP